MFAKFLEKEILIQEGRLLFSLLNAFSSCGYQIWLYENLQSKDLPKYAQLVFSFENLKLTDKPPKDPEKWIYIYDREDRRFANCNWLKKVQIRDDLFSFYWFVQPIILPFALHPVQSTPDIQNRLYKFRSNSRRFKIFFSGDTKGYTKNRIQYPKAKLSRLEIIKTIQKGMGSDLLVVNDQPGLGSLYNMRYLNKCVIVDTNSVWIENSNWLNTLSRADFFISPPGYVMPMCHNIIEAMALGTIPITNYPEWFDPSLTHMKNCIIFDDRKDLIDKLKMALAMKTEKIVEMRAAAEHYYDTYLKPDRIVGRIESSKKNKNIVLTYTKSNVIRNHSKLNKYSVLMRGTFEGNKKSWLKQLFRG